jgi:hypothetical protein
LHDLGGGEDQERVAYAADADDELAAEQDPDFEARELVIENANKH